MVDEDSELAYRSIEWVRDLLEVWTDMNRSAQRLQAAVDSPVRDQLEHLPKTWVQIVPALAFMVHPDTLAEAQEWFTSAGAALKHLVEAGTLSLSQGIGIVETEPSDASRGTVDEQETERRIQALEDRADRIERLLAELNGGAASVPPAQPRSDRTSPPGR